MIRRFRFGALASGFALLYLIAAVGTIPAGPPEHISPEPVPGKLPPKPPKPRGGAVYRLDPIRSCPQKIFHLPLFVAGEDVADWGHTLIDVPSAWKITKGAGVTVAVLDTGADHGHRDLKERIAASKDFTQSRSGAADVQGHGSHCAGIVLAEENGVGMVGVAPEAKLLVGKVLNDNGYGYDTWIAAGIDWAVEQGADVISMSLGGADPDPVTEAAIKRAHAKGVIVVCAAGNDGPSENTVGYPAAYPETVAVAAVDDKGKVASFSSRGPEVFFAAPGVNVRSCYPGDRFATMSGTSMACPYVAGCAALYVAWCKKEGLKPSAADFKARLKAGAEDIAPPGHDSASGWGIVKPGKLFDAAPNPVPPPAGDTLEIVIPGLSIGGRPVQRLIVEFMPVAPAPRRIPHVP